MTTASRARATAARRPRASAVTVEKIDFAPRAFGSASGYGNAAEQIARALEQLGTRVRIVGSPNVTGIQNAEEIATRVDRELGSAFVQYSEPPSWVVDRDRRSYGFASCDTDRLPAKWKATIVNVSEIWVPSPWCADAFAISHVPVFVVPLGVDANTFSYSRRARGEKLRILFFATELETRKGVAFAIEAFKAAFPNRDDVELVIRATRSGDVVRDDPRISLDGGVISSDALAMYYRSFDALLAPSRSEGFGLVPLEAMATGMPAIFTGAGGSAQYREFGLPVSGRVVPATVPFGRSDPASEAPWGHWFMPSPDELVDRLRELDTNYDRVMDAAESDAAAIAANWTWRRTAEKIVARLNA